MRQNFARRAASLVILASVLVGGAAAGAARDVRPTTALPFQKGVNVYVGYNCTALSTWDQWGQTLFGQLKSMGANSVALDFPFYTDGHTANTYYAKQVCGHFYTPPVSFVAALVDVAHSAGLQVFLRPYLDEGRLKQENVKYWTGNIAPSNPSLWFRNYLKTLRPYLIMAQQRHAEHFAIATELNSLETKANWGSEISLVKGLYKNDLVYTEVWRNNPAKRFWNGTSAGIDTYPFLTTLKVKSTVAQILAAWNAYLKPNPVRTLAKWTDDEVGILAQNGAYHYPNTTYLPQSSHPFNQAIQSYWFTAACAFVKSNKMGGIYFATIPLYSGGVLTSPDSSHPFFIQPLAQTAIKKCFR